MTHTIETLKELHEQRFKSTEKAIVLAASELARRLDVLNHAHELAREKERDFIGREAFETFAQRASDDLALLRRESQSAASVATASRETARKALADEITEQNTANEKRFGRIEGTHAKLIGGIGLATFIFPLITAMLIYLLTKSP